MVHTQDSSELAFGPSLALAPKHSGANKCLVEKKNNAGALGVPEGR